MIRVLGLDTGAWLGWCVLDFGDRPRFVEGGVESVAELGEDFVREYAVAKAKRLAIPHVGIERAALPHLRGLPPGAIKSIVIELAMAAWLGGELAGALRAAGCLIATASPEEVRTHAIGNLPPKRKGDGRASVDELVEAWCEAYIDGWPERVPGRGAAYRKDGSGLLAERRSHLCDAALVAVYTGHMLGWRRAA